MGDADADGTPGHAFERLMTPFYASSWSSPKSSVGTVGTLWNALARLSTLRQGRVADTFHRLPSLGGGSSWKQQNGGLVCWRPGKANQITSRFAFACLCSALLAFWGGNGQVAYLPAKTWLQGYEELRDRLCKPIEQEMQACARLCKRMQGYLVFFGKNVQERQTTRWKTLHFEGTTKLRNIHVKSVHGNVRIRLFENPRDRRT
jgi:hypothetical protein